MSCQSQESSPGRSIRVAFFVAWGSLLFVGYGPARAAEKVPAFVARSAFQKTAFDAQALPQSQRSEWGDLEVVSINAQTDRVDFGSGSFHKLNNTAGLVVVVQKTRTNLS